MCVSRFVKQKHLFGELRVHASPKVLTPCAFSTISFLNSRPNRLCGTRRQGQKGGVQHRRQRFQIGTKFFTKNLKTFGRHRFSYYGRAENGREICRVLLSWSRQAACRRASGVEENGPNTRLCRTSSRARAISYVDGKTVHMGATYNELSR